jgi:hypothetical protein
MRSKPLLLGSLALACLLSGGTAAATARVTVGHFAPFAPNLAGTSVSIRVNGQVALQNVVFGQFTDYLTLGPAGRYTVEVLPTGTSTVAISAALDLANDTDYTVLAVGDGGNQPLALLPLVDDNSAPPAGQLKLRVVHAAPFANTLAATEVSVRDNAGNIVGGLGRVPFGVASGYLTVPAASYDLRIATPDGNTTLIDPKPANLPAGAIITLVATGGANGYGTGITAIAPGAAPSNPLPTFAIGPVQVRVAHFAPFAPTLEGTAVRVSVNGAEVLNNFRFREFTPELTLTQGAYRIEVFPQGSATAAISGTVELDGNRSYTLAAVGNGLLQPLALQRFEDRTSAPPAGQYALRIAHTAPFADSPEGTEVSIRTDGGAVVAGLANVPYGAASGYLELPTGALDVKVASPNGLVNFIDLAPLNLPAGAIATAYAVGDGVNQPLGVVAIPVGNVPLETSVDTAVDGLWFNPALPGQGWSFHAVPGQNRLVGTWYTYAADGSGRHLWYTLDTCRSAPGATDCAFPGAFDGRQATFSVYESTGGAFGVPAPTVSADVGTLNVRFISCSEAELSYRIGNLQVQPLRVVNLIPKASCSIE